jgi:hypothetical protein
MSATKKQLLSRARFVLPQRMALPEQNSLLNHKPAETFPSRRNIRQDGFSATDRRISSAFLLMPKTFTDKYPCVNSGFSV